MSGDRDAIFGRIREALREAAPHRDAGTLAGGHHHDQFDQWLPPAGVTPEAMIALFAELSEKLKTEFHECADLDDAGLILKALARKNGWKRIAFHHGELTDALVDRLGTDGPTRLLVDGGYDPDALEACDAGLTACECLVAQTASVCVTAPSSGGRALSVLPPHHIVIARREQIVPDLSAAYALLAERYPQGLPSFISFITGPSRTGDIERILVLGAHGPKRLTVLLVP